MSPPEGERIEFHARGSDRSRIYQAARDQYVAERDLHMHYEDGVRQTRRVLQGTDEHGECPYPGLAAFGAEQAQWFFGRDRLTADLLMRLDERLVRGGPLVVIAPSGAGKSSLLRAGLLPALRRGALPIAGSLHWPHLQMTPTATPVAVLAAHLAMRTSIAFQEVTKSLMAGPQACAELLRSALRGPRGHQTDRRLVVIVDQLEELFTLGASEREQHHFLDLLAGLAQAGPNGEGPLALVVYGLRSDFYTPCASYPQLRGALQEGQVLVGPMTQEELREAILFPARAVGLQIEPGLVDLLLRDLGTYSYGGAVGNPLDPGSASGYEAGRLPYLAHALRVTWQQRHGHILTVDAYRRTGGIHQAIATTAERLFNGLHPAGQEAARTLFLRLVIIGDATDDTRRRLPHAAVRDLGGDPATMAAIIRAYTQARLLTQHHDAVEITHEALLHAWPRLRMWIATDRAGHLVRQELDQAAQEWARSREDATMLYRGPRLGAARQWINSSQHDQASPVASAFLAASIRHERRAVRIVRSAIATLSVLALIASVAAVIAFQQRSTARTERDNAIFSQVNAEAALLRGTQPSLAAQLDLVAHRLKPDDPTLRTRLIADASSLLSAPLTGLNGDIASLAFAPDWRTLATGGNDGMVRLWDLTDRTRPTPLGLPMAGTGGNVAALAFSPDGHTVASSGKDGAQLWDLTDRTRPKHVGQPIVGNGAVAFSPDGHTLVTTRNQFGGATAGIGPDGEVRLWDTTNPSRPTSVGQPLTGTGIGDAVVFSPDGHALVTAGSGSVKLWDVTDRVHPVPIGEPLIGDEVITSTVVFSRDGHTLVAAGSDSVKLWDVTDRVHPVSVGQPLTDHTGFVTSVAFHPDGQTMASSGEDGVRLWNLSDRTSPAPLGQPLIGEGLVTAIVFSPDGHILASWGRDGMSLWTNPPVLLLGSADAVALTPAFSPDGRTLATSGLAGTRLWDLVDPVHPAPLGNPLTTDVLHEDPVAFSPDGHTLVMGDMDGTRLWDTTDPSHPTVLGEPLANTNLGVNSVAFSPDGRTLAISLEDGVTLWNLTDRTHVVQLAPPFISAAGAQSVAFSPHGHLLATGTDDGTQLWDLTDLTKPTPLGAPFGKATGSLAFSPDGSTLAVEEDGNTLLWNLTEPDRPTPVGTPLSTVNGADSLAFSPDGHTLAIGGDSGTQLWNLTDQTHPATLGHPLTGRAAAFSPDGHTLAIAQDAGVVQLWETDIDRAINRICVATTNTLTPQQWQQHIPELPYSPPCP